MTASDIAVVAYAQSPSVRKTVSSEIQLLVPLVNEALASAGITHADVDFTCSGSCDYLTGGPFAFIANLEAAKAWPPIAESHVEMDGAWALYEAWVRLQHGDADIALVYGSGKSSPSIPAEVWPQQLDPYFLAPLGLDPVSYAGLQARLLLESGKATEADFAEVVSHRRHDATTNENAQLSGDVSVEELLAEPYYAAPLRKHDLPPISDAAAVVILARGDKARQLCQRPAWIRGIDHRLEPHQPGMRDLTTSASTTLAAKNAGYTGEGVDVVEFTAPFSPQDVILTESLGLSGPVSVNPSGGALCANPIMAAGLIRIIEASRPIMEGGARRTLAHATNGQGLQHNLVCVLEGD